MATDDDDRCDAERAETGGNHVVSIGWGDGGKTIEHEPNREPWNKYKD
jgi:hypothetical protein